MSPARLAGVALVVAGALCVRWLWLATAVGAGYAAHVTCSLVFLSGQDAERVVDEYVSHVVAPLGPVLGIEVQGQEVVAKVLGMPRARAAFQTGLGCTQIHGNARPEAEPAPARGEHEPAAAWPLGAAGPRTAAAPIETALDRAFAEPAAGDGYRRHTKAVLVVHAGRLVAERYAPGYGPETPMISWSMAKSVIGTLIGLAAEEGRLVLGDPAPVPEWHDLGDPRRDVTLDQLLRMSSGLRFDETYGSLGDAGRMLFTQPDTGGFAALKPLDAPPDSVWSYSSGTSNLLARVLRDAFERDLGAMVRWARERLFEPVGMYSALLEPDASATFIGSSFAFMTARDWARFGELHRRDGAWLGRRVLPKGWVHYVTTPTPAAPQGGYGAHWWLNAGEPGDPSDRPWPELPPDTYAARGFSGQFVVVVPSARLVVVRLGLSVPSQGDHGAHALVAELIRHFER